MILLHAAQFLNHALPIIAHTVQSSISHIPTPLPEPGCGGGAQDAVGQAIQNAAQSIQTDARIVGGSVFFIAVIIAGIMRMIAFGSERRVALSNMALTAAVVGLGILIAAPLIQQALQGWIRGGCNTTAFIGSIQMYL